jgi:hypothetical protein
MPHPFLIGLIGKKGSGKDTVCRMIQERYPNAVRLAFADALKEEVASALGVSVDFIESHKTNFRLILQGWGTEFRRELCSPNYWIEKLQAKLSAHSDSPVIITDVRFRNEAELVSSNGGLIVRVMRSQCAEPDSHRSETELDSITALTIQNSGTLDDLSADVFRFLKETIG